MGAHGDEYALTDETTASVRTNAPSYDAIAARNFLRYIVEAYDHMHSASTSHSQK